MTVSPQNSCPKKPRFLKITSSNSILIRLFSILSRVRTQISNVPYCIVVEHDECSGGRTTTIKLHYCTTNSYLLKQRSYYHPSVLNNRFYLISPTTIRRYRSIFATVCCVGRPPPYGLLFVLWQNGHRRRHSRISTRQSNTRTQ